MDVVDHLKAGWFLLREGDSWFLDVNCSQGAVSYSMLIELDDAEARRWAQEGRDFIDTLSRAVQDGRPLVDGAATYRSRNITRDRSGDVADAVGRWREATGTPRP